MSRALSKLTIGFDVDDVLVPWCWPAHVLCVNAGLVPMLPYPVSYRPWEDYGVDYDLWLKVIAEGMRSGELYAAPAYPEVEKAMDALNRADNPLSARDHVRVRLITARATGSWPHAELVKDHTYRQLHRAKVGFDWLTFSADKTIFKCDYFVEDSLRNYRALEAVGTKVFLVNRPWNMHDTDPSLRRIDHVGQYVDAIIQDTQEEA